MENEQPELPSDEEPQEITCSGGLKLDFAAMLDRRPTEQENGSGE